MAPFRLPRKQETIQVNEVSCTPAAFELSGPGCPITLRVNSGPKQSFVIRRSWLHTHHDDDFLVTTPLIAPGEEYTWIPATSGSYIVESLIFPQLASTVTVASQQPARSTTPTSTPSPLSSSAVDERLPLPLQRKRPIALSPRGSSSPALLGVSVSVAAPNAQAFPHPPKIHCTAEECTDTGLTDHDGPSSVNERSQPGSDGASAAVVNATNARTKPGQSLPTLTESDMDEGDSDDEDEDEDADYVTHPSLSGLRRRCSILSTSTPAVTSHLRLPLSPAKMSIAKLEAEYAAEEPPASLLATNAVSKQAKRSGTPDLCDAPAASAHHAHGCAHPPARFHAGEPQHSTSDAGAATSGGNYDDRCPTSSRHPRPFFDITQARAGARSTTLTGLASKAQVPMQQPSMEPNHVCARCAHAFFSSANQRRCLGSHIKRAPRGKNDRGPMLVQVADVATFWNSLDAVDRMGLIDVRHDPPAAQLEARLGRLLRLEAAAVVSPRSAGSDDAGRLSPYERLWAAVNELHALVSAPLDRAFDVTGNEMVSMLSCAMEGTFLYHAGGNATLAPTSSSRQEKAADLDSAGWQDVAAALAGLLEVRLVDAVLEDKEQRAQRALEELEADEEREQAAAALAAVGVPTGGGKGQKKKRGKRGPKARRPVGALARPLEDSCMDEVVAPEEGLVKPPDVETVENPQDGDDDDDEHAACLSAQESAEAPTVRPLHVEDSAGDFLVDVQEEEASPDTRENQDGIDIDVSGDDNKQDGDDALLVAEDKEEVQIQQQQQQQQILEATDEMQESNGNQTLSVAPEARLHAAEDKCGPAAKPSFGNIQGTSTESGPGGPDRGRRGSRLRRRARLEAAAAQRCNEPDLASASTAAASAAAASAAAAAASHQRRSESRNDTTAHTKTSVPHHARHVSVPTPMPTTTTPAAPPVAQGHPVPPPTASHIATHATSRTECNEEVVHDVNGNHESRECPGAGDGESQQVSQLQRSSPAPDQGEDALPVASAPHSQHLHQVLPSHASAEGRAELQEADASQAAPVQHMAQPLPVPPMRGGEGIYFRHPAMPLHHPAMMMMHCFQPSALPFHQPSAAATAPLSLSSPQAPLPAGAAAGAGHASGIPPAHDHQHQHQHETAVPGAGHASGIPPAHYHQHQHQHETDVPPQAPYLRFETVPVPGTSLSMPMMPAQPPYAPPSAIALGLPVGPPFVPGTMPPPAAAAAAQEAPEQETQRPANDVADMPLYYAFQPYGPVQAMFVPGPHVMVDAGEQQAGGLPVPQYAPLLMHRMPFPTMMVPMQQQQQHGPPALPGHPISQQHCLHYHRQDDQQQEHQQREQRGEDGEDRGQTTATADRPMDIPPPQPQPPQQQHRGANLAMETQGDAALAHTSLNPNAPAFYTHPDIPQQQQQQQQQQQTSTASSVVGENEDSGRSTQRTASISMPRPPQLAPLLPLVHPMGGMYAALPSQGMGFHGGALPSMHRPFETSEDEGYRMQYHRSRGRRNVQRQYHRYNKYQRGKGVAPTDTGIARAQGDQGGGDEMNDGRDVHGGIHPLATQMPCDAIGHHVRGTGRGGRGGYKGHRRGIGHRNNRGGGNWKIPAGSPPPS